MGDGSRYAFTACRAAWSSRVNVNLDVSRPNEKDDPMLDSGKRNHQWDVVRHRVSL